MYQFEETQRFRQWWVWVILIFAVVVGFLPAIMPPNTDMWPLVKSHVSIFTIVTALLVLLLFVLFQLRTKISGTGIHYQFFPIHFSERVILWDEVESATIRKYKPIREYGGWGFRYSMKHGKALNVSGDMGLQLVLKTGKKLLIGTRKAEEMERVLRDLGKTM